MPEEVGDAVAIVFLLMDPTDLVRFLREAKSQGYDSGEYVFINALPYNKGPYQFENGKTKNPGDRKLCRVNLKAGKAAALGHTWKRIL